MARHVLLGEHPLFLWGQRYKGVPEIYLSAAAFRVASPTVVTLKAVTLACFVVFLCLNFSLLERVFSRRIAWIATAFLIVGPPSLVMWTLSASAEIVMTLIAGTVLLIAIEKWKTASKNVTSTSPGLLIAAIAVGFGLWVQQYILYYIASLVVTAAIVTPDWRDAVGEMIRTRMPPWLRAALAALVAIAAVYVILGLIAWFTSGIDIRVAGVRITATHPQKMWWIAGALVASIALLSAAAVWRTQLIVPGLAFLAGYLPAIVGRIGNTGYGAPIARFDFNAMRTAFPDITGVMLPMLLGWRDPDAGPTVSPALGLIVLAIVVMSYWRAWHERLVPFFHVFPLVAIVMFFVSGSYIDPQTYRYLMPIYAALPVVYAIGVDGVWRASRVAGSVLLSIALLIFAFQQVDWYVRLTPDRTSRRAIACLDAANVRIARADYWHSYTLTFLTRERIIVSPTDVVRYPPYEMLTSGSPTLDHIGCR